MPERGHISLAPWFILWVELTNLKDAGDGAGHPFRLLILYKAKWISGCPERFQQITGCRLIPFLALFLKVTCLRKNWKLFISCYAKSYNHKLMNFPHISNPMASSSSWDDEYEWCRWYVRHWCVISTTGIKGLQPYPVLMIYHFISHNTVVSPLT